MAEFLEKEKVRERIKNYGKGAIDCGFKTLDPVNDIIALVNMVDFMPPVKVAEVKHGHWKEDNKRPKSSQFRCSVCGGLAYFVQPTRDDAWQKCCPYKYCPNCGAKMGGANNEQR